MLKQQDLKSLLIELIQNSDIQLMVNKHTVELEGIGNGVNILVTAPISIVTEKLDMMYPKTQETLIHSDKDMTKPTSYLDFERGRKSTNQEKYEIITRLMEVEGLNQTEVAKRLNYTPSRISSILKHGKPSRMKLIKGA